MQIRILISVLAVFLCGNIGYPPSISASGYMSEVEQEYADKFQETLREKNFSSITDQLILIDEFLERAPNSKPLLHNKLQLLMDAFRLDEADSVAARLLELDKEDSVAMFNQCRVKEALSASKDEYLSCYRKVLAVMLSKRPVDEYVSRGIASFLFVNVYLMAQCPNAQEIQIQYVEQLEKDIQLSKKNRLSDLEIQLAKRSIERFDRRDLLPMPPEKREQYYKERRQP